MATEASLLSSLGITDTTVQNNIMNGTIRLMLLDAGAHLDWDWLLPFPVLVTGGNGQRAQSYFQATSGNTPGCTNDIFSQAANLMNTASYRFSICETAFLRGTAQVVPATLQQLYNNWVHYGNLNITGGGITSPDNLLTHGETFIRNYLVGQNWLAKNLPDMPPSLTCWIPDDFGHDPELPIVLQAMGMIATGFARIPPGGQGSWTTPVSGGQSLAEQLKAPGSKIDFTWTAADGSYVIAHWLIGNYGQGYSLASVSDISGYQTMNGPNSPTPYIYVPVLNDFSLPNKNLLPVVDEWNNQSNNTMIAVCGSFETYAQLLQFHTGELNAPYGQEFNANPYYTGCYGSRPSIKILHQRASRNLLAAEVFSIIAGWTQPGGGTGTLGTGTTWAQVLDEAWELLLPSTHHDYITGTAIPDVYHTEQMTLLQQADDRARWLVNEAVETIAGAVNADFYNGTPVVVLNSLGFARTGIAELPAADVANKGISGSGSGYQSTAGGGLLFEATAPSLGYDTVNISTASAPSNTASVSQPAAGQPVTMKNGSVTAVLSPNGVGTWALSSVIDESSQTELIKPGSFANELLFYADGGTEYTFGMEKDGGAWQLTNIQANIKSNNIEIIETGALRVVVRTTMNYNDGTADINYITDYMLYANEPMLRMRSSGAAPASVDSVNSCSVLLAFPLNDTISGMVRGTPHHWTDVMNIYWNQQTFLATHNFVIPFSADNNAVCAFYHSDLPGWALNNQWNSSSNSFTNDSTLYACAWRNGNGNYYNWVGDNGSPWPMGTDPAVSTHEYALRMPSGLQSAATGQPLQEALQLASPLIAIPASPWTGKLDTTNSVASVNDPAAIITVAKAAAAGNGAVIFRISQPTNKSLTATLTVSSLLIPGATGPVTATGQTALERNLTQGQESAMNISVSGNNISFTMDNALATIAVSG